jgi:cystathionine gamma-synthase
MSDATSLKPDSLLVSAGRDSSVNAPLNVPLVPASNYILGGEYIYSRDDATPTWKAFEEIVGSLEQASCVSFSSGMAAIAAIFGQLKSGAVISLPDDCYQGVVGLAEDGQDRGFWTVERIATEDTTAWLAACSRSDLIWLESPSNPLLKVAELDVICQASRKQGCLVAVDNTLATALNQSPLDYGADVVIQSATKFIGGHSDLLSGVLTTRDEALYEQLRRHRTLNGATPGGLESFLATRGIRTLALRLKQAQETAAELAE